MRGRSTGHSIGRRGALLVVGVLLAGVLLAAALLPIAGAESSAAASRPATLAWSDCGDGLECARLKVPLDDAQRGGPTISLALIRAPARDPEHRIGSLVVNPGGPGGSGVDYLRAAASSFSDVLRDRFDLVSFDPRGVGASAPVECHADLDAYYALDFDPDDQAEREQMEAGAQALVQACERSAGAELPYLTTDRAARDLDRIRKALGDRRLTYLGYSYGTYLGAWYAQQFPKRVRALVLDGPIDPALDATAMQVQQAVGFERSLDLFLAQCASDRSCAFSRDGGAAAAYDALRARLEGAPVPTKDGSGREFSGSLFDIGVTEILYRGKDYFPDLARALDAADRGNVSRLLEAADRYTYRHSDGSYDNVQDAFLAIGCADGPPVGGPSGLAAIEAEAARQAPRLGRTIVNGSLPCAFWPVAAPPPAALHARGAAPILVLGTRNDPATPFAWAEGLASELESGVLVTIEGERHTAYPGNDCVNRVVEDYLVRGAVPTTPEHC